MRTVTIANRIRLTFVSAIGMVLVIGFLSFYYLNTLNDQMRTLVTKDLGQARIAEEIKTTIFDLHRQERVFFAATSDAKTFGDAQNIALRLSALIREAKAAANDAINIDRYNNMIRFMDEHITLLERTHVETLAASSPSAMRESLFQISTLNRSVLKDRYKELEMHHKEADKLASDAQRNMIIVILIMLVFALTLGVVAPNLVAAPFRRITRAIREIRTGNLNVTIPVSAEDELGTLAQALNTALADLRSFDDMKIKRIAFEQRRLETLANMVDYGVIVFTAEGEIDFINSQLYLLLKLESVDCVGCPVQSAPLPQEMKDLLLECLEAKTKFDNRDLPLKVKGENGDPEIIELVADLALVRRHDGAVANLIVTVEEKGALQCKIHLTRKTAGQT